MSRRGRRLSEEERRLWELVRRSAEPLHPPPPPEPEPPAPPKPPGPRPKRKPRTGAPAAMPVPPPPPPAEPARLDRRTRSRLSRGALHIDARLDLHGLTQDRALRRLKRFLAEAQADGARLVLVITGKGAPAEGGDFTAPVRGVLRRAVPEWLAAPELRPLVAGFDEAGRRHGGGGAIYVRIRRSRGDAG